MISVNSRGPRLAFAAMALLLAGRLLAQTNVTVDAGQPVRYVDDRMFGINTAVWDGEFKDAQTLPLTQNMGIRFLRFPGGSTSDTYDWQTNKSYQSGTRILNNWSWSNSFDDFAPFALAMKAQVIITANYGSGTAEQAAAWVTYSNVTKGYGFKYWEVGNECYGNWEEDIHPAQWDPVTYATAAKDYITQMKAADPTIKVGVVVEVGEDTLDSKSPVHNVTNPRTGATHHGWTPVMLSTMKSLGATPDFVIYHRYEQAPGAESDAGLLQKAKTWPADAADLRQQVNDYLGASTGAQVELLVTENNSVYTNPGKQSTSLVNGLYLADSMGNLLQTEFNGFAWWALHNGPPNPPGNFSSSLYGWRTYGDYGVLSTTNDPDPSYYVMKLMSDFARGGDTVVKASSGSTLLTAFAAKRTNGTLSLLVINKDPTADTTANIAVAGFTPKSAATVYSYGVPQDEAARTGTGSKDIATSSINNAGAAFSMTFPHYSATVVSLAQAAPQIQVQPTAGSTDTGANVSLAVVASGFAPLTYQWKKDGTAVSGGTAASLALTGVTPANSGAYTVTVTDAGGATVTSDAATLSVSAQTYTAPASELVNISTRAQVGTGSNVMIAGFSIGGTGAKKLLIRAVGPTLGVIGVPGVLVDPQLEIWTSSNHMVTTNDDWTSGDTAAINALGGAAGAFPLDRGSKDAALIITLPTGGYTAIVKGANATTGLALVEVYDLDTSSAARLVNLSTRAQVGTGAQAMIGGFAVHGSAPLKVLARAVGPALSPYLSGTLSDPQLTLKRQSDGAVLASNDDWELPNGNGPIVTAAGDAAGAFPLQAGGKDSALVTSLGEGTCTPFVEGKGGTTGVALVEVYEAP